MCKNFCHIFFGRSPVRTLKKTLQRNLSKEAETKTDDMTGGRLEKGYYE